MSTTLRLYKTNVWLNLWEGTRTPQIDLLRAKLALAIGPGDLNVAYDKVKADRPNALDEPWSTDMSGPHKFIVFDNNTFLLHEVPDAQMGYRLSSGCPPIDVGENIKLYLNDVWQNEAFVVLDLDIKDFRDPVTGAYPLGSLYYELIKSVDKYILKKDVAEEEVKKDEVFYGDNWDEWDPVDPSDEMDVNSPDGLDGEKQHAHEESQGNDTAEPSGVDVFDFAHMEAAMKD